MASNVTVLLAGDRPDVVALVRGALQVAEGSLQLVVEDRLDHAGTMLDRHQVDAVLIDLGQTGSSGSSRLGLVRTLAEDVPVIVLTDHDDEDRALSALRAGAQEAVARPELRSCDLLRVVRSAIERHALVADLRRDKRELETFVAHAAHDLRSPIATVAGLTEAVGEQEPDLSAEELRVLFAAVRRQVGNLSELVADLLDIAKIHQRVPPTPVRVHDVVLQVARKLETSNLGGLTIAPDQGLWVLAEESRFERMISNLLLNAFVHGGDRTWVTTSQRNGAVEIAVEDNGPGVPADFVPRLFTDFARGPNPRQSGTGLGLSIVQRLARAFGGEVAYAPAAGGGACFTVSLPSAGPPTG